MSQSITIGCTCATCKHWGIGRKYERKYKTCAEITAMRVELRKPYPIARTGGTDFVTAPDFGCTLWESKEESTGLQNCNGIAGAKGMKFDVKAIDQYAEHLAGESKERPTVTEPSETHVDAQYGALVKTTIEGEPKA
jgi:hypothetical protein